MRVAHKQAHVCDTLVLVTHAQVALPFGTVAPRLTQRFALLLDPAMYREIHRQAGAEMVSAGELTRRFIAEGLARLAEQQASTPPDE